MENSKQHLSINKQIKNNMDKLYKYFNNRMEPEPRQIGHDDQPMIILIPEIYIEMLKLLDCRNGENQIKSFTLPHSPQVNTYEI